MNNLQWQEILNLAIIIISSLPLLAMVGLPIMIISGQVLSIKRERSSYAKCAKQISKLTVLLAILLNIAGLCVLWLRFGAELFASLNASGTTINEQNITLSSLFTATPKLVHIQADLIVWGSMFAASIIIITLYKLWSSWEENRVFYQCLNIIASFWYGFAVYGLACIVTAEHGVSIGFDYPTSLATLFTPSLETSFTNSAPYLLPLAFALAGSVASIWLIIRHNTDDFGRDYYASMLKWCARFARNAWFIMWFGMGISTAVVWLNLLQSDDYLTTPEFLQGALLLLLWIVPGILWTLVLRSQNPLRHKLTLIIAFVIASSIIAPLYTGLSLL